MSLHLQSVRIGVGYDEEGLLLIVPRIDYMTAYDTSRFGDCTDGGRQRLVLHGGA